MPLVIYIVLTIIFTSCFFLSPSLCDPRITESGLYCGSLKPKTAAESAAYIPAFVKEMESLSQVITTNHFATYNFNYTNTTTNPMVSISIYAMAQCHSDLSQTDCLLCYASSRTRLPRCLPSISARIYLDGCFLRYDNYSFYNESVKSGLDTVKCSKENFSGSVEGRTRRVGHAIGNVTLKAKRGNGFGVFGSESEGVYVLGQCWESVGKDECRQCLEMAGKSVTSQCLPYKREGTAMNAGCFLKYSNVKFYQEDTALISAHRFASFGVVLAIVLAAIAVIMLTIFAVYASLAALLKAKQERENLAKVSLSFNKSGLSFKYETLEKATDYFNLSKKLGQGGNGSVYMGTLATGQTVAVKRLIFNTKQWVDEFFNEVNLISGIQHKNLVKLLGCSIEGPESLLVYEYVHNKSLDQFLFDKSKNMTLNWKQRFDIAKGTAEGLAFLHSGSEVRIIHRDIKSSNILLDENLCPKIADFGLVRCFGSDKSHLSTGIAGTIGYMAPEYLVRGQLTEKVDVYSYGVLVLEIITGKRCNSFTEASGSLLQTIWHLYKSKRITEAVDCTLGGDFPPQEASRLLQVGLLCTQASAALRPSMSQVVWMLSQGDCAIPEPNQPPFMNATIIDSESSRRTYSTRSTLVSKTATEEVGASSTSSQSSSLQNSNATPSRSEELTN